MTSPLILHLATHGFYISGAYESEQPFVDFLTSTFKGSEYTHPLLRSGIALAGANWYAQDHESTDGEEDGILNGYDALELDLSATELVVLSACRTGINATLGISGGLGLRFSLSAAGASAQLNTLWPVYDNTTKDFMVEFYLGLKAGKDKPEALRQAKQYIRSHKDYGEHPFYWAGFVLYGDPGAIIV